MKRKLLLLASAGLASIALASTPSSAAPRMAPLAQPGDVTQAHAVRICDDDGDCWWSYRRHGGYMDEDRDRGWRHGYREHDEDYYGRAPHYRRDMDRDEERGEYREHERHGRAGERERDRDEMRGERERHGMTRDESREREKEGRGSEQGMGMKEHGGRSESKKD